MSLINILPSLMGSSSVAIVPDEITDQFDNDFISSIIYSNESGYNSRNAFSEWKFNYSATGLKLVVFTNINTVSWPGYASIEIIIDGAYYQTVDFSVSTTQEITLPEGNKTVQLIEGALTKGATEQGTFLTQIWVSANLFTKINESNVSEKVVFLGDSITNGFAPTNPQQGTYSRLFSSDGGRNVGCLGWGGLTMEDTASTVPLRDANIADIQSLLSFATSKILVIALCVNDFQEGVPAASVDTWYKDLIDTLNGLDNSIVMYCISPLTLSSDGAGLDTIRNNIDTMCTARAFATHIAGKTILTYPTDFHDTVHPNEGGHTKYYDAIKTTI